MRAWEQHSWPTQPLVYHAVAWIKERCPPLSTPCSGERAGPGVMWVTELALPLTNCSTQVIGSSIPPGEHTRVDTVVGVEVSKPWGLKNRRVNAPTSYTPYSNQENGSHISVGHNRRGNAGGLRVIELDMKPWK